MKKNRIIILLLAFFFLAIIIFVTLRTYGIFSQYSDNNKAPQTTSATDSQEGKEDETIKAWSEPIDQGKNNEAKAIEETATSLIESNPSEAKTKFDEASKAYRDAGNMAKAGEMSANAMTAEILVKQQSQPRE